MCDNAYNGNANFNVMPPWKLIKNSESWINRLLTN